MADRSIEKEKLLNKLTDIHEQLEELECALEASFSELRKNLNKEEQEKLAVSKQKLSMLEIKLNKNLIGEEINRTPIVSQSLNLEMGY
ncbi:hypothetical protein [Neobacillus thermocopriae]|uniref:Uncharacterized protein n=1 Tax=Neobacillus thermocopriae TaxID=1215031 RepID=A0A6B3TS98_9BACI|nr:hypothetical protein [Neobacillus thermocopriae]MED3625025.1 hypothetical protein [Neobacillus thermocopriae]MED3712777.1 hypothetical protein [Neobacillus thermocopriae]NEX79885.1 hypothetical protein [Neobacillus thermocopriae]